MQHVRLSLKSTLDAPGRARLQTTVLLGSRLSSAEMVDVMLMLSELVTNAVRHPTTTAAATVKVDVALADDCLRIEVADGGDGFDMHAQVPSSTGGMGLIIVDAASSRWGISDGVPHFVWFELDRDAELAATG